MTDQNYTHIALVLDRSGSMESIRDATIAGTNAFIKSQQEAPGGRCTFSLVTFNDYHQLERDFDPVGLVTPLSRETYAPGGNTALRDALGWTIEETGRRLSAMPESIRPSKVLIVTQTDGYENASRTYSVQRLQDLVNTQQNQFAWQFVYLGANQDSFAVAQSYGIRAANTINFAATDLGIRHSAMATASLGSNYRATGDASFMAAGVDNTKTLGDPADLLDALTKVKKPRAKKQT